MSDDDDASIRSEQEWHLTRLTAIPGERQALDTRERDLVHGARVAGVSWEDIAEALGHEDNITVQEKYGEPRPGADPF